MSFQSFLSDHFWVITTGILTLLLAVFWVIDRIERRRLHGFFVKGKSFYAHQVAYSLKYFSGARVDKTTKKASIYQTREIENKIKQYIDEGKSIVLLGTPLRGKTRTMVECINKMKKTDCIIASPSNFDGEIRFPRKKWFCKKHLLIMDDLQDFFNEPNNAVRLIDVAYRENYIIVANCRSSGEWQAVKNAYDTISKRFDVIEIPYPTEEDIGGVLKSNNIKTVPGFYDNKNIGTLIIDLDTMRERYDKVKNGEEGKILLCMKELYYLGIVNDKREIESPNIKLLAEKAHKLIISDDDFSKAIQWTIDSDFVTRQNRGINPETVYLEQIIEPGYPLTEVIESGLIAFSNETINFSGLIYGAHDAVEAWSVLNYMKAKGILPSVNEYNQLLAKQHSYLEAVKVYNALISDGVSPDKQTFFTLKNIEILDNKNGIQDISILQKASDIFEKESAVNYEDPDLFVYWGLILGDMAKANGNDIELFEKACQKYKTATELKADYSDAFYNWGIALGDMAKANGNDIELFEKACQKYKTATELKADDYQAFYNWGNALGNMAKANGNDIELFEKACQKYKTATELKADFYQAFYNWGIALGNMAKANGNDIELFEKACQKYKTATELKADFYQAFYNWGIALAKVSEIMGDSNLLHEAKEKHLIAHRLRPDLVDENGNII